MESKKQKLVIVLRSDLKNTEGQKVRTGKLIGQAIHAAVDAIVDETLINTREAAHAWLSDGLSRVVVLKVNSESELVDIYNTACSNGLAATMINDHGFTEFGGQHTLTSLAIGPDDADTLDKVTGHLSLF
ncbi:MAG: aminoacyl-tRNA hydrolase [Candidatus Nitrosotenuis sp.]